MPVYVVTVVVTMQIRAATAEDAERKAQLKAQGLGLDVVAVTQADQLP